jgi:hypothetical protein
MFLGGIIFAFVAILCIVAYASMTKRRRAWEKREED